MKRHLKKLLLPLLVGGCASAQTFFPPGDAKKLVADGALLLDVRTPEEFAEKHLDGAKNIPVGDLEKRLTEVGDKNRPVVVYCRSGRRSETAKGILLKAGFKRVENLGSIDNWPAKSPTG
jgi:phage shock protein E